RTTLEAFLGGHREWAGVDPADLPGATASALGDSPQVLVGGVRNLLDPLFLDDPGVPAVQKTQTVTAANNREVIAVDQTYTFDPVASGVSTPAELPNLRNTSGQNVALNTGFLRPTAYQLPL